MITPTPESPEWAAMWDALAAATGDHEDYCKETGERWQYMGTFDGSHQFRHRHRPPCSPPIGNYIGYHVDRVYVDIDAATLRVTRVNCRLYLDDHETIRSGHTQSPDQPPKPVRRTRDVSGSDFAGAFDGITVTSDADPGL